MAERGPDIQPTPLSQALQEDGSGLQVKAIGQSSASAADLYHRLLATTWPRLALLFAACFLIFNVVFGALYAVGGHGFAGQAMKSDLDLWQGFFFSVHTVATIGYGNIYPVSIYANVVVVIEITLGILFFALTTGLVFARFSRPTARIRFSKVALIAPVDGVPTLMFRAANERHNLIFEATMRASLLRTEAVGEQRMRRFSDLKLLRDANPVFALTWLVMHPIDEASPLHRWLNDGRSEDDAEIVVVLGGIDDASGQPIHGRWGYTGSDIRWNQRFVDILGRGRDGVRTIDYRRFDETEPASAGSAGPR